MPSHIKNMPIINTKQIDRFFALLYLSIKERAIFIDNSIESAAIIIAIDIKVLLSDMPIAVVIESTENTTSINRICRIAI